MEELNMTQLTTPTVLALSVDEVCAATGIGKTKLYQAINSGALKARKLGKKTIVLNDDLKAFLEGLDCKTIKVQHPNLSNE